VERREFLIEVAGRAAWATGYDNQLPYAVPKIQPQLSEWSRRQLSRHLGRFIQTGYQFLI
jgi:hypothetical protein